MWGVRKRSTWARMTSETGGSHTPVRARGTREEDAVMDEGRTCKRCGGPLTKPPPIAVCPGCFRAIVAETFPEVAQALEVSGDWTPTCKLN